MSLHELQPLTDDGELQGAVVVLEFRVDGDHLRMVGRGVVRRVQEELVAERAFPTENVGAEGVGRRQASE